MGFKDRIAAYNAQKDTKVNPPEAAKVLEEKAAPEVENMRVPLPNNEADLQFNRAPVSKEKASSEPSGDAPAPAVESSATASAEAPKAKRGRPAGSKNSAKPPEAEPTTEATSPAPSVEPPADRVAWLNGYSVEDICRNLAIRGFVVTLKTVTPSEMGE